MDQTQQPARVGGKTASTTIAAVIAAAFIGLCIAVILAVVNTNATSNQTKIALPPIVTARNCRRVADGAHLLHTKLTGAALGKYYAAWVNQMATNSAGQHAHVTRGTLFNAGIAVAVCLQ